jgi:hypothetical protein
MPTETRSKTAFILGCRDAHFEGRIGGSMPSHLKRHGPERRVGISPQAAGLHGFECLLVHTSAFPPLSTVHQGSGAKYESASTRKQKPK